MKREEIVAKPEVFAVSLTEMFGAGTKIVERVLVGQLKSFFGISDRKEYDLVSMIKLLRSGVPQV
ncbi:MAG: hypothetical protein M1368_04695 [Thaumarchaeota archaeon]|nr:hypothetical protein [Nitrososphaerota archaeon]